MFRLQVLVWQTELFWQQHMFSKGKVYGAGLSECSKNLNYPLSPGYSFTSLLAIGFLVGFLTYDHVDITNIEDVYVASVESIDQFLDEDETLL